MRLRLISWTVAVIVCATTSANATPIKMDPQSRVLPGINVATSGQYDKSDPYKFGADDWIDRLLPENPTYLRSVTANFGDVLSKAFPTSTGWAYQSSANELSDNSLLVHTYDAQYGVNIVQDPTTQKWARQTCPTCVGAEFDIEYRPAGTDPTNNIHWIQVVTIGSQNSVDNGGASLPYYDIVGLADSRALFDFPIRNYSKQQEWDAELFLVTGPISKPGLITFLGGLHWGWENHNVAPEPWSGLLVGLGFVTLILFRRRFPH